MFSKIKLAGPTANMVCLADGRFNFAIARLFPVVPKPGEAGKGGARVVFSLN